ncbi:hypothetical protein FPQ18DRAFT_387407 [Pyronema domesticum]|nr:hypothetical protein FPQ18DRAFT_387407 [Pyronema domesticum]
MTLHLAFLPVILPILIICLIIGGLCVLQALFRAYPSIWDCLSTCCGRRPISAAPAVLESETPDERRARMLSNARRLQRERAEELRRQQQNGVVDLEAGTESFEMQSMAGQHGTDGSRTNSSMRSTISSHPTRQNTGFGGVFRQTTGLQGPSRQSTPVQPACRQSTNQSRVYSAPRPDYSRYNTGSPTEGIVRTATGQRVSTPFPSGPGFLSRQGTAIPPHFVAHYQRMAQSPAQQEAEDIPGVSRVATGQRSGAASTIDADQFSDEIGLIPMHRH